MSKTMNQIIGLVVLRFAFMGTVVAAPADPPLCGMPAENALTTIGQKPLEAWPVFGTVGSENQRSSEGRAPVV